MWFLVKIPDEDLERVKEEHDDLADHTYTDIITDILEAEIHTVSVSEIQPTQVRDT